MRVSSKPKKLASVPVTDRVEPYRKIVDGVTLHQRTRAYIAFPGASLGFIFQSLEGNPYELPENSEFQCTAAESILLRFRHNLKVTTDNRETGSLSIRLPDKMRAGIYKVILQLNSPRIVNEFRIFIHDPLSLNVPGIDDIRMRLRDSSMAESYLLEDVAFSDEEIVLAMEAPVRYWNDSLPRISVALDTTNFPWKLQWVNATIAQLFFVAEEHFRRNELQYSAGGLAVADMSKERQYAAARERLWQEFQMFVREEKGLISAERVWGTYRSPYSGLY